MASNDQASGANLVPLVLAWAFVGVPLLWGIYGTLINALKLFH